MARLYGSMTREMDVHFQGGVVESGGGSVDSKFYESVTDWWTDHSTDRWIDKQRNLLLEIRGRSTAKQW